MMIHVLNGDDRNNFMIFTAIKMPVKVGEKEGYIGGLAMVIVVEMVTRCNLW